VDKEREYMRDLLNQFSPQVKVDSHLSAHHVTIVTDAGGLAFIGPSEAENYFAFISVIRGRESGEAKKVFVEIPARRPGT